MSFAIMRISALAALMAACETAAQLPPDIQADSYLVRALRQIE